MRNIRFTLALAALMPALAAAFPIDLQMKSKGLDVDHRTSQMELTTVIQLTNHESQAVRCAVQFRNGPEIAQTRRVTIPAQKSSTVQYTARRTVVRMRVTVTCTEEEED
jgi:hypothetical protein